MSTKPQKNSKAASKKAITKKKAPAAKKAIKEEVPKEIPDSKNESSVLNDNNQVNSNGNVIDEGIVPQSNDGTDTETLESKENEEQSSSENISNSFKFEAPMMPTLNQEKISVKHKFTDEELLQIGTKLAMHMNNALSYEEELKVFTSQKKSQIKQEMEKVNDLRSNITNGYEYISMMCDVHLNSPKYGQKSYYTPDGEFVETQAMQPSDYQQKMFPTDNISDDDFIKKMDKGQI